MSAITREEIEAKIDDVILVQGNQSAPALAELLREMLDYIDAKYLEDVDIKTLGGVSLVGQGNIPIDFGGTDFGGS